MSASEPDLESLDDAQVALVVSGTCPLCGADLEELTVAYGDKRRVYRCAACESGFVIPKAWRTRGAKA